MAVYVIYLKEGWYSNPHANIIYNYTAFYPKESWCVSQT